MTLENSRARLLGKQVEEHACKALAAFARERGSGALRVRHATEAEDRGERWDILVQLGSVAVKRVDVTISQKEYRNKCSSWEVQTGSVIAVLIDASWSEERMCREIITKVVYSLSPREIKALLSCKWAQEILKRG